MKLHCEICSRGGERPGPHSEIATIDEAKLRLPLLGEMFTSICPERGLPDPWHPSLEFRFLRCPRGGHLPFVIPMDDTADALKRGGPEKVLTDAGWVELSSEGWVKSEVVGQTNAPMECPKCGKGYKDQRWFDKHVSSCQGAE